MDSEWPAGKTGGGMGPGYWRELARGNSLLRRRYPLEQVVTGTVLGSPGRWGVAGLFVGLGDDAAVVGFVDLIELPNSIQDWPAIGTESSFLVSDHVSGQVRMKPLDPAFRRSVPFWPPMSDDRWSALKERHPTGSVVTATVQKIFWPNSHYSVNFDQSSGTVDFCGGPPPTVGSVAQYVVGPVLDRLRWLHLHVVRASG